MSNRAYLSSIGSDRHIRFSVTLGVQSFWGREIRSGPLVWTGIGSSLLTTPLCLFSWWGPQHTCLQVCPKTRSWIPTAGPEAVRRPMKAGTEGSVALFSVFQRSFVTLSSEVLRLSPPLTEKEETEARKGQGTFPSHTAHGHWGPVTHSWCDRCHH